MSQYARLRTTRLYARSSSVFTYPVGGYYANFPVTGQDSRSVRPGNTTSNELLVCNNDETTSSQRIEIVVVGGLTGRQWTLQSMSSRATGLVTVIPGNFITTRFEANSALTGSAGCNSYSGSFTAYGQTLRVSNPLATGAVFCGDPAGVVEQEQLYLSLLQSAVSFQISAGQLSVFDGRGNRVLVFFAG